ncbi:hypothetical protein WISP_05751 [Willisornis vidua]|uniref:Uncharacterized protein n=1 Tax=Willisornis vidua TaxID=1566151 RepID=A0ABQ9DXC7_9PASS|nr:hypothetical protein WISP_05751 [Willisornis vidua]
MKARLDPAVLGLSKVCDPDLGQGIVGLGPRESGIVGLGPRESGIVGLGPRESGIVGLGPRESGIVGHTGSSPEQLMEPPDIPESPEIQELPNATPGPCQVVPLRRRRCVSVLEPSMAWEEEEEEEEEEEPFQGVSLRRARTLRSPPDPFRRHSWEPGKELQEVPGYDHLRVSSELGGLCHRPRDPRRAPLVHSSDDLGSLLSQDEEEEEEEADMRRAQEDSRRLQGLSQPRWSRSKSASLGVIPSEETAEIPPFASQQSLFSGAGSGGRLAGGAGTPPGRDGTPLDRTLGFIRRMTGKTKVGKSGGMGWDPLGRSGYREIGIPGDRDTGAVG